jgi:hypothetical protein
VVVRPLAKHKVTGSTPVTRAHEAVSSTEGKSNSTLRAYEMPGGLPRPADW